VLALSTSHQTSLSLTPEKLRELAQHGESQNPSSEEPSYQIHRLSARPSTDQIDGIVQRYEAGESARSLASECDIAPSALIRLLRERNVVVRQQVVTSDQEEMMARDYEAGMRPYSDLIGKTEGVEIESERLVLESISPDLARRIVADDRTDDDNWHPEYPFEDELVPLAGLAATSSPDPVFTMYLIRRKSDSCAIGGFGFFGPPDGVGQVEFGYGLVASARGAGLATEAVRRALEVAAEHGALSAVADTDIHNRPSQRVLEKAGLLETSRDESTIYFSCPLV
jgi:RimJ/RimL family protein N-acetyltransferase